jgi:hypothetical protein
MEALRRKGTIVAFYRLEETARRYQLRTRDIAQYWPQMLSILRIMAALLFMEHGTAKLLGFPHGPNQMLVHPACRVYFGWRHGRRLLHGACAQDFLSRDQRR